MEATTKRKATAGGAVALVAAATGLITAIHGSHTTTTADSKIPVVINRPHDVNGSPLPVTITQGPNGGPPIVIVGNGAPSKCSYRATNKDPLYVLPDKKCNPGATNPLVTQANIQQTICDPKWDDGRPSSSVTNKIKSKSLEDYGLQPEDAAITELDHLIPVRDGGAVADPRNLWVEPNYATKQSSPYVHNPKDAVELSVYNAVCHNKVTLHAAQRAMATNWTTARAVLHIGSPTPTPSRTP